MVFRLEVVRVAAVALILELATLAGDRVMIPVVERRTAAGRGVAFVRRLDAGEC